LINTAVGIYSSFFQIEDKNVDLIVMSPSSQMTLVLLFNFVVLFIIRENI
jgi:hypothetical protein